MKDSVRISELIVSEVTAERVVGSVYIHQCIELILKRHQYSSIIIYLAVSSALSKHSSGQSHKLQIYPETSRTV